MADVKVRFSCGRSYLSVNGFVAAVEGDMCRDYDLPGTHWNEKLMEMVVQGVQPKTPKTPVLSFSSLPPIDAEAQYRAQKLKEREEHDTFVAKHLKETFGTVESNHNEMDRLWLDWSHEGAAMRVKNPDDKRPRVYWEQISRGFNETLGVFRFKEEEMPIVISAFWARLRLQKQSVGQLVMFWELCSQVTDSRMAERFLDENTQNAKHRTDSTNFHIIIHGLKES